MKLFFIIFIIYPFSLCAQSIESRQVAGGIMVSHDTKGAYLQRVWTGDNNWFGSVGLEVQKPKDGKPFIPFTIGAGYSFGVPFIVGGAGAGFNTSGQYGTVAEIGAGIRVSVFQASVNYRAAALPIVDQEASGTVGNGWVVKVGFVF